MGKVNLASTQTKLRRTKDKQDDFDRENDYMNSSINELSENNELNNSNSSFNKRLTPQEEHDKKIQKGLGFQIKLKQHNFLIY